MALEKAQHDLDSIAASTLRVRLPSLVWLYAPYGDMHRWLHPKGDAPPLAGAYDVRQALLFLKQIA